MKPLPRPALALLSALALASALSGCASRPDPVDYARAYPKGVVPSGTADIQIFRSDKHVELTNTTPRAFGPSTLWLNAWYSRPIDGLAVGETLKLPLKDFRDEFGDAFRGGGFFAAERPERLVLAQLETPTPADPAAAAGEWVSLVVVGGEGE